MTHLCALVGYMSKIRGDSNVFYETLQVLRASDNIGSSNAWSVAGAKP